MIVTGGSKGIGLAIAQEFAKEGAAISICARGQENLDKARKLIETAGGTVHAKTCDVSDPGALQEYIESAVAALDGLNILVNNPSGFGRTDDEQGWQVGLDIDLMALVRGSWAAVPHIEKAGGGALIHTSSISGLTSSLRTPPYGAVKAAVIQYTKTQALQLAKKNIRVNNEFYVCPVYNEAIQAGSKIKASLVDEMWGMGTPEELNNFLANYKD